MPCLTPPPQDNLAGLGPITGIGNYVASGVVVFDLHRRTVKWSQHLDLSTDGVTFKAYAYSSPTLADIDADGKMEVILGTSVVRGRRGVWRVAQNVLVFVGYNAASRHRIMSRQFVQGLSNSFEVCSRLNKPHF